MIPQQQLQVKWFHRFQLVFGIMSCMALLFLASCTTAPSRPEIIRDRPIEPTPRPIEQPVERPRSTDNVIVTDIDPSTLRNYNYTESSPYGWILTNQNQQSIQMYIDKASQYSIGQIHLSGDFLTSIDELIFDMNKKDFVQRLAQQLDSVGIELYLWSHELNLDNARFSFMHSDPLVAARKSAYQNVLSEIPEIDGVVIVMHNSAVEPWNAQVSPTMPQLNNPERVRFVTDMIRSVVVDDHRKKMMVMVSSDNPEINQWYDAAFASYLSQDISLIKFPDQVRASSQLNTLGLVDLSAEAFGGPVFIYSQMQMLNEFSDKVENGMMHGGLAYVQSKYGSIFDTPNELNLEAFSRVGNPEVSLTPAYIGEWVQGEFNVMPLSPVGILFNDLYLTSNQWAKRMFFADHIIPVSIAGDAPTSINELRENWQSLNRNDPRLQRMERDFQNRNKQILVDLAQESYEAMLLTQDYMDQLQNLRWEIPNRLFSTYYEPLAHQNLVAQAYFYLKQCTWGFLYWQQTRDEMEALHLEAHLQALENIANQIQQRYGNGNYPGNPQRFQSFVASIRSEFPRVIMGWKEREWNKLSDYNFRQAGTNSFELGFMSDKPSLSKLFITTELPTFSRMETISNQYSIEHRYLLSNLQPGVVYYVKFQIEDEQGNVVNSGVFEIQLDPQQVM